MEDMASVEAVKGRNVSLTASRRCIGKRRCGARFLCALKAIPAKFMDEVRQKDDIEQMGTTPTTAYRRAVTIGVEMLARRRPEGSVIGRGIANGQANRLALSGNHAGSDRSVAVN
nr:hypothetical protein CFP56_38833 [Quercus suber]